MNAIDLDMIEGGESFIFLCVTVYQQEQYRNTLSETGMTRNVWNSKKEKNSIIFGFQFLSCHPLNVLLGRARYTCLGNHVQVDYFEDGTSNLQAGMEVWTLKCLVTHGSAFLELS